MDMAAWMYAKTSRSFESVALHFINRDEHEALKTYLLTRLSLMDPQVCCVLISL